MTKPIELIKERLEEITMALKKAINNDLMPSDLNKMVNIYNEYYTALQLLNAHTEIKHDFSRLLITTNGKARTKKVKINYHRRGLEQYA